MTLTLIKPRLLCIKSKQSPKVRIEENTSILPQNLQIFKQKILSENGFLVFNFSPEVFDFLDNETSDNSITKRNFVKTYHQQAANLNDSDQNIESPFGGNSIYHQIGNAYFHYEMTIEKGVANAADRIPADGDVLRLVNNALAYCFKEARLSTIVKSDFEHNKFVGQVSTIRRTLTNKDDDFISHFDKIDETAAQINNTSLKHLFINNHSEAANKGEIKENYLRNIYLVAAEHLKRLLNN